jgi:hypothetical protein
MVVATIVVMMLAAIVVVMLVATTRIFLDLAQFDPNLSA